MSRKAIFDTILVAGIAHLFTLSIELAALHWILKLGTMALIWGYASTAVTVHAAYKRYILAGLLFCMAGDAFLLVSGSTWFMLGLSAFLIGHLIYIAAFANRRKPSLSAYLAVVPIAAYAAFMAYRLHAAMFADQENNSMWIPVLAYLIVISAMLWMALLSGNRNAMLGAVCFVLSDSILAWNKFIGAFSAAGVLIMLTYFAAQLLIASSVADPASASEESMDSAAL